MRGQEQPRETQPSRQPKVAPQRANLLLERVVGLYAQGFEELPEGRASLDRHGIADARLLSRHRVGFAGGKLGDLLPRDGRLQEELKTLGVLLDDSRERFAGCVVFPVFDAEGSLTTLCGRFVGSGPPPTSCATAAPYCFLPGRPKGLWNAPALKTCSELILVEPVLDALSVMVAGHANVIAVHDADGVGEAEVALLKSYAVQAVTLLFADREPAVLRSRLEAHGLAVRAKALPVGHDANSWLVAHGAHRLAELLTSDCAEALAGSPGAQPPEGPPSSLAMPDTRREIHGSGPGAVLTVACGLRRYEIRDLEKGPRRLKATLRVEHAGRLHVDTLDLYSARGRRLLAQDLCRRFDETPETVEADIDRLLRHCESLPDRAGADLSAAARPAEAQLTPEERAEAEAFGRSERLFEEILADYEACGLVGERANKLLCYLAMTSRRMEEPLSVLILSSSGAGKTALQDTALTFCPPEDLVKLTSLSGKALFYKEPLALRHKALALEEGAGAQQATYAIRNLITARELVIESAVRDRGSGKITTMTNRVEGPTAVFVTTTDPNTDPETRSRFFVTAVDESREQTRAILCLQRRRHTLGGLAEQAAIDAIVRKHRNFQRLLRPLRVVNPYAERLSYGDDRLQSRRDQPKYLNLIKAVTFLRQMQRELKLVAKENEPAESASRSLGQAAYVEADLEDIRFANELANEILGRSLDELSAPARGLLLQIVALVEARLKERDPTAQVDHALRSSVRFTRREVREFTGWTNTRLHIHLKELADFEYVIVEAGRNGLPFRYRLVYEGQGQDGRRFLLGLKDADTLHPMKG
jgi:DNA primase